MSNVAFSKDDVKPKLVVKNKQSTTPGLLLTTLTSALFDNISQLSTIVNELITERGVSSHLSDAKI
ncbi:hypothetical protein PHPALM_31107 [Phytophthora palmivora]|uniref:Uncharacterized protein n=1 Tax=Phytophthora palmivora TaxID=4796 RepID=A0A2P4X3G7_9STRA|nr:hypothetical protein PHPALM_31107 [Phytophthora palmivora]